MTEQSLIKTIVPALRVGRGLGLNAALRRLKGQQITVLNLHQISDEPDSFFEPIVPALFEKILDYCGRHYEVVTFLDAAKSSKKPKLILSFDDGYYDFMEHALPLLKKKGLPCNHNLVNDSLTTGKPIWTQRLNDLFEALRENNITDDPEITRLGGTFEGNWIRYNVAMLRTMFQMPMEERNKILDNLRAKYGVGNRTKMMRWPDAVQCVESGLVEIGSHTYNHDSLASVHDTAKLDVEIGQSVKELEEKLHQKIIILAAPNGQFSKESLDYARSNGIKHFLMVRSALVSPEELSQPFSTPSRISLVNESFDACVFRIEMLFAHLMKIKGK